MRAWWLEASGVRPYRASDRERLFKWVVFEREGGIDLVAMPYDAGYVFHMEAIAQLALRSGWCGEADAAAFLKRDGNRFPEAGVRVLGGGVRFENGHTRNFSYRFGAVPEPEDRLARIALRLTER